MLVLERKLQEGFWIEDRIFVKILGIGRRRVKIGIEAPLESKIIRDELKRYDNTKNNSGGGSSPEDGSLAYLMCGHTTPVDYNGFNSPGMHPYDQLSNEGTYRGF